MEKGSTAARPAKQKTTLRLLKNLLNAKDFSDYVTNNSEQMTDYSFTEYLDQLCVEKAIPKSDLIRRSGIERTYAYQLIRGDRNPTRDKVIQLAVGLSLNVHETQALLRYAQKSELYPRIKRDAALIFCLERHMTFLEIQDFLSNVGEELLSSGEKTFS